MLSSACLAPGARFRMNQQARYALAVAERDHRARIAPEVTRAA